MTPHSLTTHTILAHHAATALPFACPLACSLTIAHHTRTRPTHAIAGLCMADRDQTSRQRHRKTRSNQCFLDHLTLLKGVGFDITTTLPPGQTRRRSCKK
jgi:hypothetical protein